MTELERLYNAAVVPVVVIDDATDAVLTAKALLAGGVDVMEITFRTAAELAKNGFTLDESTAKYKGEKMVAVYLKQEFGGFAVHLLQK